MEASRHKSAFEAVGSSGVSTENVLASGLFFLLLEELCTFQSWKGGEDAGGGVLP